MTANRRIFLNVIATYGRYMSALVSGLFCGSWTLVVGGYGCEICRDLV